MARRPRRLKKYVNEVASSLLPHRSRDRRRMELLGGTALVLFSVVVFGTFVLSGLHRYTLRSPDVASVVTATLVELANHDRVSQGVGGLVVNPRLVAAARAKANDMAEKGYFSHASPEGYDSWYWFEEVGYEFEHAGENLAIDFSDSADVERAWMASPSHRENILNGNYSEIGIATAQGMYQGRITTFVVQMFGSPTYADVTTRTLVDATEPAGETIRLSIEPATVSGTSDAQVLGTQTGDPPVARLPEGKKPVWSYFVSFPHNTLRYVYYVVGFSILISLAVETGLEIRWHHRKRAVRAGILLAFTCALYFIADMLFFTTPVLALVGI